MPHFLAQFAFARIDIQRRVQFHFTVDGFEGDESLERRSNALVYVSKTVQQDPSLKAHLAFAQVNDWRRKRQLKEL